MRERYKIFQQKNIVEPGTGKIDPAINRKNLVEAIDNIQNFLIAAARAREIDILDYNTQIAQNPKFYSTAPTSSSDLIGTEKAGDIAADTSYLYVVVDNAGTLEWQRVAISTF